MIRPRHTVRAFTLVELIVSIAIFALMTALVVVKYGSFNQNLLLTNLAYDVAGSIRTAQTYGLSVKSSGTSGFTNGYAMHFRAVGSTSACHSTEANSTTFLMISEADTAGTGTCDTGDEIAKTYKLTRGAQIQSVCAGSSESSCTVTPEKDLVIHFRRPNPDADIRSCTYTGCSGGGTAMNYAKITIQSPDGSTRTVSVRANGQISVSE